MKRGEETGLNELGFGDRSSDAEHGFAGKEDRAFRESPNIAGEAELREIVEEVGSDVAKDRQSADVGDFVPGKVDVFEEVQSLFETSGDEIVAMRWQVTDEQFESGAAVNAILDIAGRHGEFIEVGEKAGEESAGKHAAQEIMPGDRKEQSLAPIAESGLKWDWHVSPLSEMPT